jgi:hypothetical protein
MKAELRKLFDQLASSDQAMQEDAALFLGMLLERHIPRRRNDATHEAVLPHSLLQLELTSQEKEELLAKLCEVVTFDQLPPARRASLAGALATCGRLEGLEVALNVFAALGTSLDEDSVYSMMACITPTVYTQDRREDIKRLLTKYQTEAVLAQLAARGNDRLAEPIRRLRRAIVEFQ